ncbi:MAG: ROK family protein [Anaerolineae bacterium]|jgi:polyphosphate glucokinase|nr:ROK family protein [Anaerolineae bacterium]
MDILGIDIGGSGIKGAIVDTLRGVFLTDRHRIDTPDPSTPKAVADVVAQLIDHFDWKGVVGCTFPAIVKRGVVYSAANVDKGWIGTDAHALFQEKTGLTFLVLNDADAAGLAEMAFGAGRDNKGIVMVLTFGTGIGSAIFVNHTLVPNTELGHLEIRGKGAERRASDATRKRKELDWEAWAVRVNEYLAHVEFLFSPDLIIFGGGVSKKHEEFFPFLQTQAKLVPAELLNDAGIIGAALAARHRMDYK